MSEASEPEPQTSARWILIRDVGVLQVKLFVDGFRDLLLLPASLAAGIVSLLNSEDGKPAPHFYRLLALGKESERWINLFGALTNSPERPPDPDRFHDRDIDTLVSRVESFLVDEYRRGGVTRQAKERLDHALDVLQRAAQMDKADPND